MVHLLGDLACGPETGLEEINGTSPRSRLLDRLLPQGAIRLSRPDHLPVFEIVTTVLAGPILPSAAT
jgi:hypothetical protein